MASGKEHIINCAFDLFLEKGYERTSMADLVEASNLSKGAFYHHFQSKKILFRATIDHFFLNFFDEGHYPKENFDLLLYIEILWKSYSDLLIKLSTVVDDISSYYQFIFTVFNMFPDIKEQIEVKLVESKTILEEGFSKMQKEGKISSKASPKILTEQLLSMIEGRGILIAIETCDDIETTFGTMVNSFIETITLP